MVGKGIIMLPPIRKIRHFANWWIRSPFHEMTSCFAKSPSIDSRRFANWLYLIENHFNYDLRRQRTLSNECRLKTHSWFDYFRTYVHDLLKFLLRDSEIINGAWENYKNKTDFKFHYYNFEPFSGYIYSLYQNMETRNFALDTIQQIEFDITWSAFFPFQWCKIYQTWRRSRKEK